MITTTHTLKLPAGQEVTLTTAQLRELHTEIGRALDPEPKLEPGYPGLMEKFKELTKQSDELWRRRGAFRSPPHPGTQTPVVPQPPFKRYCHGTDELFMRGMTTSAAPTLTDDSPQPL